MEDKGDGEDSTRAAGQQVSPYQVQGLSVALQRAGTEDREVSQEGFSPAVIAGL